MVGWRDRALFIGVHREFRLGFTWYMRDKKVKKRITNKSKFAAICLKVLFGEAKIISYCPYIVKGKAPYNF